MSCWFGCVVWCCQTIYNTTSVVRLASYLTILREFVSPVTSTKGAWPIFLRITTCPIPRSIRLSDYPLPIGNNWVCMNGWPCGTIRLRSYPHLIALATTPQRPPLLPEANLTTHCWDGWTCLDEAITSRKFIGNLALGTSRCLFWRR
jgi:hypothetical protein